MGFNFLLASTYCTRAHTLSLDSYNRPTAGKSSSPAGLSTLVYAYVVDSASASLYTYPSSTHRFLMSAHLSSLRLFQRHLLSLVSHGGQGVGITDQPQCRGMCHSSSPSARSLSRSPCSSPPSFTQSPSPPHSLVRDGQTSPHRTRLVVSRSTCPPLSPNPHANSFVLGTAVINTQACLLVPAH